MKCRVEYLSNKYVNMSAALKQPFACDYELQFIKKPLGIGRAPVESCAVVCPCHQKLSVLFQRARELGFQQTNISASRETVLGSAAHKSFEAYACEIACLCGLPRDYGGEHTQRWRNQEAGS